MNDGKKQTLGMTKRYFDNFLNDIPRKKSEIEAFFSMLLVCSTTGNDANIVVDGHDTFKSIEEIVYKVLARVS
ncbi:MAG: hypothetical protein NT166_27730 [Candidatus Aminicenantes bacterium]|nr:hypothetical protein [Candidatus Aminicenantes bacterium]